jgi:hypothetical protein
MGLEERNVIILNGEAMTRVGEEGEERQVRLLALPKESAFGLPEGRTYLLICFGAPQTSS